MTFDEHERYFKERCVCYVGGKDDLRGAIREAAVIEKKKSKKTIRKQRELITLPPCYLIWFFFCFYCFEFTCKL